MSAHHLVAALPLTELCQAVVIDNYGKGDEPGQLRHCRARRHRSGFCGRHLTPERRPYGACIHPPNGDAHDGLCPGR